ncbi:LysE family translocator [Rhodoferax sp.]|uniref:LysE family translocator n=1 Tax=Rhodoferax sp. TaxID=50421 RepID=UPI002ACD59C0|nr:LysE family translocator [Rhodoferax sp.]MDZ7919967.1 LysE family translocator [Rhodoferax sp.]
MNTDLMIAAALFLIVSSVTPGPNNTMLMASGVNFGVRRSLPHLLGVQIGFTVMLLCVGLDLHAVLDQFPALYQLMRWGGAAYLLWLAWKLATARPAGADTDAPAAQPLGFWGAAAFQWINPKAWVMIVAAMSAYLPPDATLPQVLLLALMSLVLGSPCSAVWLGFGQAMRGLLQDPLRLRIFNVTMALALVASLYPMLMP